MFATLAFHLVALAAPLDWAEAPRVEKTPSSWIIHFELTAPTDVEVAIVGPDQRVIRHLAAGVLGTNPPPPLVVGPLAQSLVWDLKDDHRQAVEDLARLSVRIRAGMGAELEHIAGGDPYAYYSREMGDNDHSPWGINGLAASPDGARVYVWGHSSNLGPPALRTYDIDGRYRRTLFPMPAGRNAEEMAGWGIERKEGGRYTPLFKTLVDPSLTSTFLDTNLRMARLLPRPAADQLSFVRTGLVPGAFDQFRMRADGGVSSELTVREPGPIVLEPSFELGRVAPGSHTFKSICGPWCFTASPDGATFYLSGMYAATTIYGSVKELQMDGFWRDGRVWKVDRSTGKATVFFELDGATIPRGRRERSLAFGGGNSYAALHGTAVDGEGRVFVADRLNQRILVLDPAGKVLRSIPQAHADSLALSSRTGALYVTTREGDYHRRGALRLLKFADWRRDDTPTEAFDLCRTGHTGKQRHAQLLVCEADDGPRVWVAHAQLPVRVYRDVPDVGLRVQQDFYTVPNAQRCLGFDRLQVDPVSGDAFLLDAHDKIWRVTGWPDPRFELLPIQTSSIGIDARRRLVYIRALFDGRQSMSTGRLARFHLDRTGNPPAPFGNTGDNKLSEPMTYEWCFEGTSDKGIAVAPNGEVAVVGSPRDGLRVFAGKPNAAPWKAIKVADLPFNAGGVRFDLAGNLYVGRAARNGTGRAFARILKFAPTGTLATGLFPTRPSGPAQTYQVPYGPIETKCATRSPRFGLDGFARIYYPTSTEPRVTVIDNRGNQILRFGTYGNRDSMGGLPGDQVPTPGIPLAFPNSVDATDTHIYVADMVNLRLLRIRKTFKLSQVVR